MPLVSTIVRCCVHIVRLVCGRTEGQTDKPSMDKPSTVTLRRMRRGLINRKANCILCTFKFLDPLIKTYLVKSYCLSLYGCVLWSLSSVSLKSLQIAINKILRKIWHLPRHSHISIVLCVAKILYIHEIIFKPTLAEHVITNHTKSDNSWCTLLDSLTTMDGSCKVDGT